MSMLNLSISLELKYHGICDASAAIPLGQDRLIVANDEDNILRVYQSQISGEPAQIDIHHYFDSNPDNKEIDIEGVTELNGLIYWITSHGRSKKGKLKEERHQFFACRIADINPLHLEQVGKSYTQLVLTDMINDSKLDHLKIKEAAETATKTKKGLNIEGLTTTPQAELLIAFRSPIINHKALLIPLKNPRELIGINSPHKAYFGEPILLDLHGLGIRSIEYWSAIDAYIIVAGSFDSEINFALYYWSGKIEDKPLRFAFDFPNDFRPESIIFYPHINNQFQLLSDDGSVIRGDGQECKDIKNPNHPNKFFRSIWLKIA